MFKVQDRFIGLIGNRTNSFIDLLKLKMADVAVESVSSSTENTSQPGDEDETYLYGDESSDTKPETQNSEQIQDSQETIAEQKTEDDEDGEFEESDDDDDDNIQVHIGEVNTTSANAYGTPVSWKKDNQTVAGAAAKSAALPTQGQKKIDVNAVGLINGQPIYEFDLDNELDEKPWRKPGADISDYFNYGFTEDTWKQYCEKQRRMRLESNRGPYTVTAANPVSTAAQVEIEVLPDGRTRVKAGPPPDRKVEGSIHVLGSDDARRKQKEEELLALALGQTRVMAPTGFPGQRPLYTALPGGTVMYNPMTGQQILQPPSSSQGETSAADTIQTSNAQQIQSIGASMINSVLPGGIQYLQPGQAMGGMQPIAPGGPPLFQTPHGIGMDFPPQDPFLHPGMPPGFNALYGHSDDDYDSDSENRRHRSRRDTSSRHRRHRDRDRDGSRGDRDRDRDRSRRDRDRSESRSRREHSKSSSDRKKHSSRSSSSIKVEEDESGDRKSRSSRRSTKPMKEETVDAVEKEEAAEIKQEPVGD